MTIVSSGSGIAGESYSLTCSATLVDPVPLPSNIPAPNFEWFLGPNGNAPLPSGVAPMSTSLQNSHTYTSSLQFSPLTQCHAGMYTCRLGVGILANSIMITVNGKSIDIVVIISLNYDHYLFLQQLVTFLSRSLLVDLQCWEKVASLLLVVFLELIISIPL